jgi:hypothetical protein
MLKSLIHRSISGVKVLEDTGTRNQGFVSTSLPNREEGKKEKAEKNKTSSTMDETTPGLRPHN